MSVAIKKNAPHPTSAAKTRDKPRRTRRVSPVLVPDGVAVDAPDTDPNAWAGPYGKKLFVGGILVTAGVLFAATLISDAISIAGFDPRPFAAALPLIYVPMLLGGVGWLVWASDPARKHDDASH